MVNTPDGLPNSRALGSTGDTITNGYDNTDSPSAITLKNSTSTLQSFTYSDAPASDILSETDTPASSLSPATYTYDPQTRLTSMPPATASLTHSVFHPTSTLTPLPTS